MKPTYVLAYKGWKVAPPRADASSGWQRKEVNVLVGFLRNTKTRFAFHVAVLRNWNL